MNSQNRVYLRECLHDWSSIYTAYLLTRFRSSLCLTTRCCRFWSDMPNIN